MHFVIRGRIRSDSEIEKVHDKLEEAFVDISYQKGFSSQDRFEKIFEGSFRRPSWFKGVRRATVYEDLNEGTDFFIITHNFGEIRFDVKSSFSFYERQKQLQETKRHFVWGIVIKPHLSDEAIRQAVFKKCDIHIYRLKKVLFGKVYTRVAS